MANPLRRTYEYLVLYASLGILGALCLAWSACALVLHALLPERLGTALGRAAIMGGFRAYGALLTGIGAYRLDLAGMDALRDAPPMILAPNHPSLIDALVILGHDRRVACVMKSSLMRSPFLGAGARLARYVRNESPRQMIRESVANLRRGAHLLLFPEGTRTATAPVGALGAGIGVIARKAGVDVQTLLIETDSPFLGKGWPLHRAPALPIRYRVRLGRRFAPPADAARFAAELEAYYREALGALPAVPAPAGARSPRPG